MFVCTPPILGPSGSLPSAARWAFLDSGCELRLFLMLIPQPGPVEPVVADAAFLFTIPLSIRLRTKVLAHLLLAPELLVEGTADIRRRRLHAAASLCTY